MIREYWENLNPKAKRWVVVGIALLGIVGGAYISTLFEPPQLIQKKKDKIHHLLTDTDPRSLTLDALAVRIKDLETQDKNISSKLDKISHEIQRLHETEEARFKSWSASQRNEYERRMQDFANRINRPKDKTGSNVTAPKIIDLPQKTQKAHPSTIKPWEPEDLESLSAPNPATPKKDKKKHHAMVIRVIGSEQKDGTNTVISDKKEKKPDIMIPAGSILSGVLLNGMDAATSQRARQNPQPVLVRIKREAILPNRYRSDVRECFLIAAGYGDLSSERAYIRSEKLACIGNDRNVLENKISSYAVGEDGKVGIRGRLVSKQGRLLANALLAGFAKGISQIFGRQQVPVVVTNAQQSAPFQRIMSAEAAQAAVVRGTGEALETLARYYLDMAENIFPVIEVDAGRKVELILNEGFRF